MYRFLGNEVMTFDLGNLNESNLSKSLVKTVEDIDLILLFLVYSFF